MIFARKATYCRTLDRAATPSARRDLYLAPIQTPETIAGYQRALDPWYKWCERNERCDLPASDPDIIDYLLERVDDDGISYPMIHQFMAALSCLHVSNNCERENGPELRALLKSRRLAHKTRKATPFERWQVREMIDLAKSAHKPRRAARDAAFIAVSWETWKRSGEAVEFNYEDIARIGRLWIINIPRSKGDQRGRGQRVRLRHIPDTRYCSICLLEEWFRLSSIHSGAVFRQIYKNDRVGPDRHFHQESARVLIRQYSTALNFGAGYSPNSFRRGGATDRYKRTGDITSVKEGLRHKYEITSWEYVDREASANASLPYFR
jgi:integrase